MKNLNRLPKSKYVILLLISLAGFTRTFALTYTSINNGNYNNTINVWSTDGGATPCGCAPPVIILGHTININHNIALTSNLVLNSALSSINISTTGTVTGAIRNVDVTNGTLNINGNFTINKLTIGVGGVVNVVNADIVLSQKLDIYGDLNINEAYFLMTGGSFNLMAGGSMTTANYSKIDVLGGNIEINDQLFICSTCCLTTLGNWSNLAGGTVVGSGSAQTTSGNMSNAGTWSAGITWCSNGFDFGMPTPENCGGSSNTCGIIALPVQLSSFIGVANEEVNVLTWITSSEVNNDFFILEKSSDMINWEEVERVKGAGNSNTTLSYSAIDKTPFLTTYYRLKQVDFDNKFVYYDPIVVSNNNAHELIISNVYPNPADHSFFVNIFSEELSYGELYVSDSYGRIVYQRALDMNGSAIYEIPAESFVPGIYMVKIVNQEKQVLQIEKVVIR